MLEIGRNLPLEEAKSGRPRAFMPESYEYAAAKRVFWGIRETEVAKQRLRNRGCETEVE
jgi:hypothetical protein